MDAFNSGLDTQSVIWYRDAAQDGSSTVANPRGIGRGGWQVFKSAFAGGNGVIYALTSD